MRKCETVLALPSFGAAMLRSASSSRTTIHLEPLRPVNRLRVPPHYSSSGLFPNAGGGSVNRMCSRCSSLLSMASSSRYSLNTAGGGFVPCSPGAGQQEQFVLCKLCLGEVPISKTTEIIQCGCSFCKDVSISCQLPYRLLIHAHLAFARSSFIHSSVEWSSLMEYYPGPDFCVPQLNAAISNGVFLLLHILIPRNLSFPFVCTLISH
jgi:hypothetical protein